MVDFSVFGQDADVGSPLNAIGASQEQITRAANVTGGADSNWFTTIAGDAALGVVDLADTVASSIPGLSRAAGIERGTVNAAMLRAIDSPGLADFYNKNRQGIEVASGIEGVIAAEVAGRLLTKGAAGSAMFMGALKSIPGARRVATLDSEYHTALQTVRQVDAQVASRGITGAEMWSTVVPIRDGVVTAAGPSMGIFRNTTRAKAATAAAGRGFLKGAGEAARSEAVMATFLNQNEFLYSEDAGQNMMWMGLGVALGGGMQVMAAGYQMRKFVNSDSIRRLAAGALDPTGLEQARINALTLVDPETAKKTYLGSLQGSETDRVTSFMVSSKSIAGDGVDASAHNRMSIQNQQLAHEGMQKVTVKGLAGQGGTAFAMDAPGYGDHIKLALQRDSGAMLGTEMVGGIDPATMSILGTHEDKVARVAKRKDEVLAILADDAAEGGAKAAAGAELKNLKFQERLTPMVLMDGELMPLEHGAVYDNWVEPGIKASKPDENTTLWEAFERGGRDHKVGIDSNGEIYLPGNKSIADADHFDVLRLYRTSQSFLSDLMTKVNDPKFEFNVPFSARGENGRVGLNWFHLDLAEELMERSKGTAKINWGPGLTRESAMKESFALKAEALRGTDLSELSTAEMSKLRLRYNLPRLSAYEMGVLGTSEHPLDVLLRGAAWTKGDTLFNMSLNDIKRGFAEAKNISDLTNMSVNDVDSLSGSSFSFMMDEKGNPLKPVLTYKRPFDVAEWTKDRLAERIAVKKVAQASLLTGPQTGPMTRALSGDLLSSPDFQLAAQTSSLLDTQIAGNLPGLQNIAPQTGLGSILNSVVSQEWRARDNPVILAATRLRETVDRQMRGFMRTAIEGAFGDSLAVLNGPRNTSSKVLLDQFHTFRPGWDLEKSTIRSGENMNAFVLSDTVANRRRFQAQFGREMGKGQTMLNPQGKEVVLDDLALDAQNRFNQVTDLQRVEKNSLLRSQGLPELRSLEWYVPPQNVQGKYIGFTYDASNEIVPGGTIITNTQEQFDKEKAKMLGDVESVYGKTPGASFRTRDEIREFNDLWDRAQMEMMNPGTTAIQSGKSNRGALTGQYTNVNQFDESMRNLRDTFLNHGDDVIQTLMKDQINAAKARSNIAGGLTRNADSKQVKYRSVYDYWLEAIQGRQPLNSSGSAVGWLYNGAETRFNDVMREVTPKANAVWQAATDFLTRRTPWDNSAVAREDFGKLSEKLGQHMPFESALEMAERRSTGAKPVGLAEVTGNLNRFSASWMLRYMEAGAPLMNMAGILNSMPSVIRNISMRDGEDVAEYANRVGHSATIFTDPNGRSFGALDMGKIMWKGFKRAWGRTADAEFDFMAKNGFLSQEVAEFQRQFNAVESRGALKKFFMGDPTSTNKFTQKGLDGWMGILTDKSEDFSRSWAHMIGLEAAEMIGVTQNVAKHNFAHDLANKMIANYSPHNKPEIFQGAVGAPIGLFQSFMWAYYQRMFRYIETGDAASIGIQYAMQGTLFGSKSVPGFEQLNNMFFENSDGQTSPYDALYRKFGHDGGDMLMAGVLSNLPKMFGAEGVDLVSRGDVSPRIVTTALTDPMAVVTASAPVTIVKKIKDGIGQGVALFSEANPQLTSQQVGEVLSNMIPNRPIAGMIEQLMAGGKDTDRTGQLVAESKTWMDATYRMMGLRSLEQSKQLEAFYANKQAMEINAGQQEILNRSTRGLIRGGNMDDLPAVFEAYVDNGGDPRNFRRWLSNSFESATKTRSEQQLEDVVKNPNKMHMVERLLDAQVGVTSDAETEDPVDSLTIKDPLDGEVPRNSESDDMTAYQL